MDSSTVFTTTAAGVPQSNKSEALRPNSPTGQVFQPQRRVTCVSFSCPSIRPSQSFLEQGQCFEPYSTSEPPDSASAALGIKQGPMIRSRAVKS
jgi:hypothetical protein